LETYLDQALFTSGGANYVTESVRHSIETVSYGKMAWSDRRAILLKNCVWDFGPDLKFDK